MAVGAEERRSKSVEPGMMSSSPSRGSAQRKPSADVWQRKTGREAAGGSREATNRSGGMTGRSASTTGEVDIAKGLHNLAITRQKINESVGGIRKYFRKFNTNKNGILTREELHDGFHRLGMGLTHEDINFLVNSFDLDGSNDIEYNEFAQTLALSDPEMVTKVLAYNAKHVPEWQKPRHWHFTPADESKAEELRTTIRERLWASYGDDPMAMRKAFLDLDSDRAGVLDQQDMAHSLKKVSVWCGLWRLAVACCESSQKGDGEFRILMRSGSLFAFYAHTHTPHVCTWTCMNMFVCAYTRGPHRYGRRRPQCTYT